jgi:hypothetical protein
VANELHPRQAVGKIPVDWRKQDTGDWFEGFRHLQAELVSANHADPGRFLEPIARYLYIGTNFLEKDTNVIAKEKEGISQRVALLWKDFYKVIALVTTPQGGGFPRTLGGANEVHPSQAVGNIPVDWRKVRAQETDQWFKGTAFIRKELLSANHANPGKFLEPIAVILRSGIFLEKSTNIAAPQKVGIGRRITLLWIDLYNVIALVTTPQGGGIPVECQKQGAREAGRWSKGCAGLRKKLPFANPGREGRAE